MIMELVAFRASVEKNGFLSTKISIFQLFLLVKYIICAATRIGLFLGASHGARISLKSGEIGRQKGHFFYACARLKTLVWKVGLRLPPLNLRGS